MAHQGICSVSDCGNTLIVAKGLCERHYRRFRKHGDPTAGRIEPGAQERYFTEVVLQYDGNECLKWPYSTTPKGYGYMSRIGAGPGKRELVHRRVCEAVNGPPPTPQHEAAHSCGKGLQGCCAKRHLSWKTSGGNMADKYLHGTVARGEMLSKLTEEDVRRIRVRLSRNESQTSIAKDYGVSHKTISKIHVGETWRWLE
jgi:hypothetical protein